jgi:hypothetical protein
MWTLIRPFSSVTANMALQLAQLHTGIVAFGAFVWFFVGVLVTNMTHQFAGCCEAAFTEFAGVWLDAGVGVDVVL